MVVTYDRIAYVRNLPYKISADEMYELFGRYGNIHQIRMGDADGTRGMAFVVYDQPQDAKGACTALTGYNLMGRFLVVNLHKTDAVYKPQTLKQKEALLKVQ